MQPIFPLEVLFDEFMDYVILSTLQSFKSFRIVEDEHLVSRAYRVLNTVFTRKSM